MASIEIKDDILNAAAGKVVLIKGEYPSGLQQAHN
jgi:hypothetical protein